MNDPMLKIGSNFCECPVCGLYFTSVTPFAMHRVEVSGTDDRRCLTTDEMEGKGMSLNDRGYWRKSARPAATLPPAPG